MAEIPFENYGGAQWMFDGPRGGVYRAANGQYVYQDQVFNSLGEVQAIINGQGGVATAARPRQQGPDGLWYELGTDNTWHLLEGMSPGSRRTQVVTVNGISTLYDLDTGEVIRVLGPAGSSSSGSGGSSSGGLIAGHSPGVNTNTGSLVSSTASADPLAAANAQREWQAQQNELDRAQRAAEFAAQYGLSAAQYQLGVRDRADAAAKTYGELVSSADTAALPAYLSAGGGNLFNALASSNSMLTQNAVRPGAMALDNARYYQGLAGGAGGAGVGGANGFDPSNPWGSGMPIVPPAPVPQVLNPDGTVSHGGPSGAEGPGGGRGGYGRHARGRGESGLGSGATGYMTSPMGRRIPQFDPAPKSYGTSGFWPEADAAAAFAGYEQAQQMQYDERNPQTFAQLYPSLYPGATFWQSGQLMYNTPNGPIPASMVDPYTLSQGTQAGGSPYNTNAYLPLANQQAVASDPRSLNPNLNLSPLAQSSYVKPAPGEVAAPGMVNNNGVQSPIARSVAPNVARFARGGLIRGVGIVGDQPSGRPTGHEELVIAPQGALVLPIDRVRRHSRGGVIDPFAVAGSESAPAAARTRKRGRQGGGAGWTPTFVTPDATPLVQNADGTVEHGSGLSPSGIAGSTQQGAASNNAAPAAGGMTVVNGPSYVPPGTPVPNALSEEEVRRWRESFPIPVISGPYGVLNPFDVGWGSVDPTAREAYYNANQTRYGIPAASQAWEATRFALPGVQRPGWSY